MAGELSQVAGELSQVAGELSQLAGELSQVAGELSQVAGEVSQVAGGSSGQQRPQWAAAGRGKAAHHVECGAVARELFHCDLLAAVGGAVDAAEGALANAAVEGELVKA